MPPSAFRFMTISKFWLGICLAWAMLGGVCLYFIDDSLVEPVGWLVAGVIIGYFGRLYLDCLLEVITRRGKALLVDPVSVVPVFSLVHGLLFGSLVGAGMAWAYEGRGWHGAVLGAVLGPYLLSLLLLVGFSLPTVIREPAGTTGVEVCGVTRPYRAVVVGLCLVLPVVLIVVLVRCLLWIPRRWRRLKLYVKLQELGGVFGADPGEDQFYGITFRGAAVGDEVVGRLRTFPELDHLGLAGTAVTDAGLARLRALANVKIMDLARTAITDTGLTSLQGYKELQVLYLSGTQVGDEGLVHLQGLQELRHLDVRATRVTETGIRQLKQANADLKIVG